MESATKFARSSVFTSSCVGTCLDALRARIFDALSRAARSAGGGLFTRSAAARITFKYSSTSSLVKGSSFCSVCSPIEASTGFAPGAAGEFSPPSESGADSLRPQPAKNTQAQSAIPRRSVRTRSDVRIGIRRQENLTVRGAARQSNDGPTMGRARQNFPDEEIFEKSKK